MKIVNQLRPEAQKVVDNIKNKGFKKYIKWFIIGTIGFFVACTIFVIVGLATGLIENQADSDSDTSTESTETTKEITETSEVPFETEEVDDSTLAVGYEKVTREGKVGEKTITYKVTIDKNGVEIKREKVKEEITTQPVTEILAVGTATSGSSSSGGGGGSSSTRNYDDDSGGSSGNSTSTYYANCTAAKNAGAAPIHRGQPGYRDALDRDGDGVACDK